MINKHVFRIRRDGEPYSQCFCTKPELIENYDKAIADKTQVWECHHRREEFYSYKELIERGEYFDRPPEELIFLTKSEHHKIDSACKRIAESMKGKRVGENNPFYGKYHSEEAKRKMSVTRKGRPCIWCRKKVLCVETGTIYESATEAAKMTNTRQTYISDACNGRQKTAAGYHWKYI